jgi:preprotein translocase subunit SecY
LIFTQVVATFPVALWQVQTEKGPFVFGLVIVIGLAIVAAVIFIEQAQRRIPVQYARRMVGRKMFGGSSTYIPLKVNQSGVVPIIFASSVLLLPVLLSNMLGSGEGWRGDIVTVVDKYLVNSQNIVYIVLFSLLIILFAYFYNSIAFDPIRQADQLRRQGGFIPGIRPGPQTERYLAKAVNRITLPGAVFVAVIAILPYLLLWAGDVQSFPFAGTTVLIAVGVALELMRQIDATRRDDCRHSRPPAFRDLRQHGPYASGCPVDQNLDSGLNRGQIVKDLQRRDPCDRQTMHPR